MGDRKKLKVYYDGPTNKELDDSLIALMEKYGYKFYALGTNHMTQVRDLAFDLKG